MNIEYAKSASKVINSLDSKTKQRIKKAIEGLTEIPPKGDIKQLQGHGDGRCRLRKGGIRVLFKFVNAKVNEKHIKTLYIIDVGARGDIYK
ncbi:MAG: type II toxin-antitoxin system RelE/ParE family toxin [Oscillospiraceae bacterium]|nr:type II toxin-antitoxin system RelE/ParE family toxin [Oscillospiraceae bacterium]